MNDIIYTLITLYFIQVAMCGIIHIIKETKIDWNDIKVLLTKDFNIIWVLYNLKNVR